MKDPKIKGDQYVTIQIAVPQNLTEDAKRKIKRIYGLTAKPAADMPQNRLTVINP